MSERRIPARWLSVASLTILVAACSSKNGSGPGGTAGGEAGGGASGDGGTGGSGTGGRAGMGGDAGTGGTGGTSVCTPMTPPPRGPARLRRLSATEYRNSVRDLLPGVDVGELELVGETIVNGFENNATVQAPSTALIEKVYDNAVRVAGAAQGRLDAIFPCDRMAMGEAACGRELVRAAGRRFFRRPLDGAEATRLGEVFESARMMLGFQGARTVLVQTLLQAPQFLYRLEPSDVPTPFELATRVSYLVWQSTPDEALLAAAEAGNLTTPADIEREVRRMLADARARDMWVDFARQWLTVDRLDSINKDSATYPEWGDPMRDSMREEIERNIVAVLHDGDGRLGTLLTSRHTWVDEGLARIYGVTPPAAGTWAAVELDGAQRAGILTRLGFLATRGHAVEPSPVLRGVTVLERLLCMPPPAPPPDVNTTPPSRMDAPTQTNRQRYELHETNPVCANCHKRIDGIGFSFEAYDSIGRFRSTDSGAPVDATGTLSGTDVDGMFTGAVELSERLARSKKVEACMATQWFRFAFGRDEGSEDQCTIEKLAGAFSASGGDFRELLVQVAVSEAYRTQR